LRILLGLGLELGLLPSSLRVVHPLQLLSYGRKVRISRPRSRKQQAIDLVDVSATQRDAGTT
jgi:hypothetical protein